MNSVILNGINSNTVRGLLIQSLPPVSKPLMRTQIEEIDGRDGDIVTPLGYSAYDKEMEIGLHGDFDIDDVISFFDSEGTVTFSDEPDKFYNYQILEQIDFEKLIRYRTAKVTFHVQPFKYSAVEEAFDYVNDIVSVPDQSIIKNGVTVTVSDGEISVSGTASAVTELYLPIEAVEVDGGTFDLKAETTGTGASACSLRVVKAMSANADSLGETFVRLKDNATVKSSGSSSSGTYNYVWIYIEPDVAIDINTDLTVSAHKMSIINYGNAKSKPVMSIYGSGVINLSVNGGSAFAVNTTLGHVTLDVAEMEAYSGNVLMNRYVSGDFEDLMLRSGKNVISWSGDVTKIVLRRYSRWI